MKKRTIWEMRMAAEPRQADDHGPTRPEQSREQELIAEEPTTGDIIEIRLDVVKQPFRNRPALELDEGPTAPLGPVILPEGIHTDLEVHSTSNPG